MKGKRLDEMAWSDLRVIMAIGRAGSLSGAARTLGCTHSTVYRKIGAIEDTVGVRFFERLPSGYALTEAGAVAMRYATRVEGEFDALHREVLGLDAELEGAVVVTGPIVFTATLLPRLLADFRRQHPGVTVEAIAGGHYLNLRRREADIAIRATNEPPQESLGKRICDFRFGFYASAGYLAAAGDRPLAAHDFIVIDGILDWFVPAVFKTRQEGERRTVFTSNDALACIEAARAGMGVVPLSCYSCDPHDDLVRLQLFPQMELGLWVLVHPDLRRTARVMALRDFLAAELRARAALFEGRSRDG